MTTLAQQLVTTGFLRARPLPGPSVDGDKEERGRVLIVGGSLEIAGAALLAANAALRAGAGKVTVVTDARIALPLAMAVPEARVVGLAATEAGGLLAGQTEQLLALAKAADAVLLGPGMCDAQATLELVRSLVCSLPDKTILLDALAMDAVGSLPLRDPSTRLVLTPHAGEMAHLTGLSREQVCQQADACALEWAQRWDCTLALKGASTWIATPDSRLYLHEAGNPGLGVSGSGDCLAGVIVSLLARGAPPAMAVCWGVWLHAQAGQRLAERQGPLGFLARELAAELPALLGAMA
jgi:ADP-dependent NAD(P)H-hydrate dehydratase